MRTNWISRQPMKYWALSLSLLGLGACSSTKNPADTAADASYSDVPSNEAIDAPSTEAGLAGGAEGSLSNEMPALDPSALGASPVVAQSGGGVAYRESQFPEIASRPIQKGTYLLNGYVFVRTERNWKDLSKLLYGREDRAALLAEWNGNAEIAPGSVVYYNSPFRPDDSATLKSFDSDFGMTLSGVSVAAGDTLSSIAAKVYGNVEGWHELATLNADLLRHPDSIEVGQTLRLSPKLRDTASILQAYVQKVQTEATAALSDPSTQTNQVAQENAPPPSDQIAADAEGSQAPPAEELAAVEAPSGPGILSGIPMTEVAGMLVALLAVAGLVAFYVHRRKKLVATNAANTVFFTKKTGTED